MLRMDKADTSDITELEYVWLPILAGPQRSTALTDQTWSPDRHETII
jgi:hypothetical protein